MVAQFALPKKTRDQSKRTDVHKAGILTEAAENAPRLALDLAKRLFSEGDDLRKIHKQTGWYPDEGRWLYDYSDQGMKVREDNRLLQRPGDPDKGQRSAGEKGKMYEQPGIPMKKEPGEELGYTTRGRVHTALDYDPVGEVQPTLKGPEVKKQYQSPHGGITPKTPDRPPLALDWMDTPADPNQMHFGEVDPYFDDPFQSAGKVRSNYARDPTFEELFSHPLQEQLNPDLGKIPVEAIYTDVPSGSTPDYSGGFNPWPAWYEPAAFQRLDEFQPGSVNEAKVRARGQLGGVQMPYSMESVALHEVGGHGAQQRLRLPQGANAQMPGMDVRGKDEMPGDAAKQLVEMSKFYREELAKLQNEEGLSAIDAGIEFRRLFPDYWPTRTKYNDVVNMKVSAPVTASKWTGGPEGKKLVNDPAYLGYRGSAGEQQAMNLQTRAIKTQNELPMTGEPRWEQFPNSEVAEANARRDLSDDTRPHQGDVYPLDTYEIPPDLTEQRVVTGLAPWGTIDDVSRPALGDYDWMWKGGMGAAGAGTLATLASPEPASASEGPEDTFSTPKTDRLPAASPVAERQDRLPANQQGRIKEAGQMFAEVPQAMTTGLREAGESALGLSGDMGEYLPGIGPAVTASKALLPSSLNPFKTTEDAAAMTDWLQGYLPEAAQATAKEWTQHEDTSPMDWMYRNVVANVADPVDIGLATGASKLGRMGLAKLKGLR